MQEHTRNKLDAVKQAVKAYHNKHKTHEHGVVFMYRKTKYCKFEVVPANRVQNFKNLGYSVGYEGLQNVEYAKWVTAICEFITESNLTIYSEQKD